MNNSTLNELKKVSAQLKPQFFIGKNGITQEFITEIKNYLQKYELVKIKSHTATNSQDLKTQMEELEQRLNAEGFDVKGYTFCLHKEND